MGGCRRRTKGGPGKWLPATDDLMHPALASQADMVQTVGCYLAVCSRSWWQDEGAPLSPCPTQAHPLRSVLRRYLTNQLSKAEDGSQRASTILLGCHGNSPPYQMPTTQQVLPVQPVQLLDVLLCPLPDADVGLTFPYALCPMQT